MVGTDPDVQHASLDLRPDAAAPGAARRFLMTCLGDWGCPALADDALLCVGELVTNAVLHARTRMHVEAHLDRSRLRVTVADESPLPVSPPEGEDVRWAGSDEQADWERPTLTGRGLRIVDRLAGRWGVDHGPIEALGGRPGKQVWFELVVGPEAPRRRAGSRHPEPEPETAAPPAHPAPAGEDHGARVTVRIEGVPPRLMLASDANLDDLLREFTLETARPAGSTVPTIGPEVAALVEGLLVEYAPIKAAGHEQAQAAAAAGMARFTLELELPAGVAEHVSAFLLLMDEVDRICREGSFLTLVPPPEVAAFRRWYVTEAARQAAGEPPERCPFPE